MKITLSLIKADIGSIGGHITPSKELINEVRRYLKENKKDLFIDSYISSTGDDIAILLAHQHGKLDEKIHKLAWDAFMSGTEVAKKQGLYGAGQDLLVEAFSGNVKGMGPAVAELEFEERPNEPFLMFAADKTDPGAYNLPFYLAFADPMYCSGSILSPKKGKGIHPNPIITIKEVILLYDELFVVRFSTFLILMTILVRHFKNNLLKISTIKNIDLHSNVFNPQEDYIPKKTIQSEDKENAKAVHSKSAKTGRSEISPFISEFCMHDLKVDKSMVFIGMPFSNEFEDVYFFGIKDTLKRFHLKAWRSDEVTPSGQIFSKICRAINQCNFAIIDISGNNPNVMIELGIASAVGKRIILIKNHKSKIPSDLAGFEYIEYKSASELQKHLYKVIPALLSERMRDGGLIL